MNALNNRWALALGIVLSAVCVARAVDVPRWQVHDFAFKSDAKHENPFTVDFSAEVTGPNGIHFTQLGFYDGAGTWILRLGPNLPGKWSIKTISNDPKLNSKTADLNCVEQHNSRVNGGLLVDPEHPHHFVREDGTRFFYSGFECDWLWALDLASGDPKLPQTSILLDKLVKYEFNVLYVNLYAHSYGGGKGSPSFGPPPMYAWGGSNDKPDHSVFNLPFWQHYDRVMQALWERGIETHLMIKVYNKHVTWPAPGSPEDDRLFKYTVARFGPFSNVHWDFAKESNRDKDMSYKLGRMALVRKVDPYRRLLTTHTDSEAYPQYIGILDYRTAQKHKDWHSSPVALLKKEPWPNVDAEYGYEAGAGGTNDSPGPKCEDARTIYNRAWEVYMSGAYGAYYYAWTSWSVIRVNDTPDGYGYFLNLSKFFTPVGLWLMESHDSLVSSGYCLANPGVEYVVYQPEKKEFTLKIEKADGPLAVEWFNPLTGERAKAENVTNGQQRFVPPAAWGEGPVALHVGTAPATKKVFRNTFERPLPSKTPTDK